MRESSRLILNRTTIYDSGFKPQNESLQTVAEPSSISKRVDFKLSQKKIWLIMHGVVLLGVETVQSSYDDYLVWEM